MKKITYKILSFISPRFKYIHQPKYTNFGELEDYSKVIDFAKNNPDIQITEELKNRLIK